MTLCLDLDRAQADRDIVCVITQTVANALINPNYHVLTGNDRCKSCRDIIDPPDLPALYERWPCAGIQMGDGTFKHACLSCAIRRIGNCRVKPTGARSTGNAAAQQEDLPQSAASIPQLGAANPLVSRILYFPKGEGEDAIEAMKRDILSRSDEGDREVSVAL